jgi:serine/threonine-protein phosphatase 5
LTILLHRGLPSFPEQVFIFNGDFVDRGHYSVEIMLILMALKCHAPDAVYLNRGNHESRDINGRDGFEAECRTKYSGLVYDAFQELFAALPLGVVLHERVRHTIIFFSKQK